MKIILQNTEKNTHMKNVNKMKTRTIWVDRPVTIGKESTGQKADEN